MSTTLEIHGFDGEPLPNTFVRRDGGSDHLGMIFPGISYTTSLPALHYSGGLLLSHGADLLCLDYAYSAASRSNLFERLSFDVSAACDVVLAAGSYDRLTLVGKSLGTLALAHLMLTRASDARFRDARYIWLTPLLRNDRFREAISSRRSRSLFVIGTADDEYDPDLLAELERVTGGEGLVVDGAGHGLEIPGDVVGSIRAIERIILRIEEFLG